MTSLVLPSGTQSALETRDSSECCESKDSKLNTLANLLDRLAENPPRTFPMLKTTCSLLEAYLARPADQILIDSIEETRDGFRPFLVGRKYAQNSIRTYINHVRILLEIARTFGWSLSEELPEEWRSVLAIATEKKCVDIVQYLAGIRKAPKDVTVEDVDRWAEMKILRGLSYGVATKKKNRFWRLLHDCGCTQQIPICILRAKNYGVPIEKFPPVIKREALELLRWKQAAFVMDRPKKGHHRAITAKRLRHIISTLFGFAVNICGATEITSLGQLIQKQIVGGFIEWSINERQVKGESLQRNLRLLPAVLSHHPSYADLNINWLKPLIDSIPVEPQSALRERKARKYLEYHVLELIPGKIRAQRRAAEKNRAGDVPRLVMEELIIKWFITLPWRQRNVRECRIGGAEPNLFKGIIPPFSDIDKPDWVSEEEHKNPAAEFWQFRFSPEETKTKIEVRALLPRQLIRLLEEYLKDFRPSLIEGTDPGTLVVNHAGRPMTTSQMTEVVSDLTLRHGGRRVTPHPFRDIVAYTWLKEHPKDFLTLSKMLWHSNINTTIQIYGSRFNESSGVSAMESWLDEREAKTK